MLTAYQEKLLKDKRMWITLFALIFLCFVISSIYSSSWGESLIIQEPSLEETLQEIEEMNRDEEFGDIETLLEDY